jgi:hypothetical protein
VGHERKAQKLLTVEQVFANMLQVKTQVKVRNSPNHEPPTIQHVRPNKTLACHSYSKRGFRKTKFHNFQLLMDFCNVFFIERRFIDTISQPSLGKQWQHEDMEINAEAARLGCTSIQQIKRTNSMRKRKGQGKKLALMLVPLLPCTAQMLQINLNDYGKGNS